MAKSVNDLLNYPSMHYEAITRYHVSGMILQIHSNASFLSDPETNIRAGGYHYLSTKSEDPNKTPLNHPPLNGPVHVKCTTMQNVLTSAMESEMGAIYINFQRCTAMRMSLTEMVQAQPPTLALMNSSTGNGFANDNIRQ